MERELKKLDLGNGYTAYLVKYFTRGDVIEIAKCGDDKLKAADVIFKLGIKKIEKDGKEIEEDILEFVNKLPIQTTKKIDDFLAKLFESES